MELNIENIKPSFEETDIQIGTRLLKKNQKPYLLGNMLVKIIGKGNKYYSERFKNG